MFSRIVNLINEPPPPKKICMAHLKNSAKDEGGGCKIQSKWLFLLFSPSIVLYTLKYILGGFMIFDSHMLQKIKNKDNVLVNVL